MRASLICPDLVRPGGGLDRRELPHRGRGTRQPRRRAGPGRAAARELRAPAWARSGACRGVNGRDLSSHEQRLRPWHALSPRVGVADIFVTYRLAPRRVLQDTALHPGVGVGLLVVVALALGDLPGPSAAPVLALAGLGPVAVAAYGGFYKALELGPIAIVSPIASSNGAMVVVLAVVVLGESLTAVQALACCSCSGSSSWRRWSRRLSAATGRERHPARPARIGRVRRLPVRARHLLRRPRLAWSRS